MKVIKFAPGLIPVFKHQQHDQSTHGSWATGVTATRELLLSQAGKFETYEQFHLAVSLGGLRPKAWHIADEGFKLDPNRQPTDRIGSKTQESGLFLGDPEYWQEYATGRETVIEYDVSRMTWTKNPLSDTKADFYSDQSGNQGFFVRSQGFGRLKEVGRLTLAEAISRARKQQDEMPNSRAETKQIWDESRSVRKHAQHDQSTHGNWATGNRGGSGLSLREMFNLKRNRQDPLAKKVYEAEEKNHNQVQDKDIESPSSPVRADFDEWDDYAKAHKKYSRDFLNWSKEVTTSLISPIAEKHLDGTPTGVTGYVRDVLRQDWFLETFGSGGEAKPTIEMLPVGDGAAGKYSIGFKNGRPYSRIRINRSYSKNEPIIVHEIAHYATTISATSPHDGHGVEFARNHIFVASKVLGSSFADGLEKSYREAGVPLGD